MSPRGFRVHLVAMASGFVLIAAHPGISDPGPYPYGACCTSYGCEAAISIGGGFYCCNGICQPGPFGGSCAPVCCSVSGGYVFKPQACCFGGSVSGQDCDFNGLDDRCEADCDADGTINACELNPGDQDCNYDGVCNDVNIAGCPGGSANCDCNSNSLPDVCETWESFVTKSKHQPLDYQSTLNNRPYHRIDNAPEAVGNVHMYFRAKADLEAAAELIHVRLMSGTTVVDTRDIYVGPSGVSCGTYNETLAVPFNGGVVNSSRAANGGAIVFRLDPSSLVEPCTGSYIQMTVYYQTADDCDYNQVPDVCDPDCNNDEIPDFCEIQDCPSGTAYCADCNVNGVPDGCDISLGTSDDCHEFGETGYGVPDECDAECDDPGDGIPNSCEIRDCPPGSPACADCQPNEIPDRCDIAEGTSLDCQAGTGDAGDGSPDECDLVCAGAQNWCQDCNANGIPDNCDPDCDNDDIPNSCEIAACPNCQSPGCKDCNGNGIPDDCDIAANPALDCPGYPAGQNGIPDSCEVLLTDSNGNGVADSCDIASGQHPDCDQDGVPDDGQNAVEGVGSRYLAIRLYGDLPFAQPPPVATTAYALQVTTKSMSCLPQYVQLNGTLGALPVYRTPAQWCALGAKARDEIIIPSNVYTVEAWPQGGGTIIALGNATTRPWGDVSRYRAPGDCAWGPPDGIVTIDDCLAIQARINNEVGAPLVARADIRGLMGCFAADGLVNSTDLQVCHLIVANPGTYVYPCQNPPCNGGPGGGGGAEN